MEIWKCDFLYLVTYLMAGLKLRDPEVYFASLLSPFFSLPQSFENSARSVVWSLMLLDKLVNIISTRNCLHSLHNQPALINYLLQ